MNWTTLIVFVIVAIAYIFLKRSGQISAKDALACLKSGALIVDVRTPAEFTSRHLPNALNFSVDQIETTLPRRIKDKNQPILLHCETGTRSGAAKRKLIAMGYTKAFNLGSYGRAARILNG